MKKRYYDAASLERVVLWFERQYGMASRDFFEIQDAKGHVEGVPGFHRHFWASCYRDLMRMRGADDFAEHAERVLEPAC